MRKFWSQIRNRVRDEQGATLVLTVLGIVVFLGMVALAVDLGVLLGARTESQRVADAAALAGAGSLITAPDDEDRARQWAIDYAAQNTVLGTIADMRPEDVDVLLDEDKVRVRVYNVASRSSAIKMVFGRVLGWQSRDVSTVAAAEAVSAGSGACPFPAMIPDRWIDRDTGPNASDGLFDENQDAYEPYYPDDGTQCEDWGCTLTNNMPAHYTGFASDDAGYNLGDMIELVTHSGPKNKGASPTDPLVDPGLENYQASPCVSQESMRCWWLPSGTGTSEIRDYINGCESSPEIPVYAEGDDLDPEPGMRQSALMEVQDLVETYGGDQWDWNPDYDGLGNGCMVERFGTGRCMEEISKNSAADTPEAKMYGKRHRAIPIVRPDDMVNDVPNIDRWACIFVAKTAKQMWMPGPPGNPTPNGYGPPGQWNVYVRFVRCSDGMIPADASGQTLKTLRLVRY